MCRHSTLVQSQHPGLELELSGKKIAQKRTQRKTLGQVCSFKMSPILKHSDHVLNRNFVFSQIAPIATMYIHKRHLAFFSPFLLRDLRKNDISLQDVVRMFQNWAHFEGTYLPCIIPLKNHRENFFPLSSSSRPG